MKHTAAQFVPSRSRCLKLILLHFRHAVRYNGSHRKRRQAKRCDSIMPVFIAMHPQGSGSNGFAQNIRSFTRFLDVDLVARSPLEDHGPFVLHIRVAQDEHEHSHEVVVQTGRRAQDACEQEIVRDVLREFVDAHEPVGAPEGDVAVGGERQDRVQRVVDAHHDQLHVFVQMDEQRQPGKVRNAAHGREVLHQQDRPLSEIHAGQVRHRIAEIFEWIAVEDDDIQIGHEQQWDGCKAIYLTRFHAGNICAEYEPIFKSDTPRAMEETICRPSSWVSKTPEIIVPKTKPVQFIKSNMNLVRLLLDSSSFNKNALQNIAV